MGAGLSPGRRRRAFTPPRIRLLARPRVAPRIDARAVHRRHSPGSRDRLRPLRGFRLRAADEPRDDRLQQPRVGLHDRSFGLAGPRLHTRNCENSKTKNDRNHNYNPEHGTQHRKTLLKGSGRHHHHHGGRAARVVPPSRLQMSASTTQGVALRGKRDICPAPQDVTRARFTFTFPPTHSGRCGWTGPRAGG